MPIVTLKVWRKMWGHCELSDILLCEEGKFVLKRVMNEWGGRL